MDQAEFTMLKIIASNVRAKKEARMQELSKAMESLVDDGISDTDDERHYNDMKKEWKQLKQELGQTK